MTRRPAKLPAKMFGAQVIKLNRQMLHRNPQLAIILNQMLVLQYLALEAAALVEQIILGLVHISISGTVAIITCLQAHYRLAG
jgi:hypothetical protein